MRVVNLLSRIYRKLCRVEDSHSPVLGNCEIGIRSKVTASIDFRAPTSKVTIGNDCTIAGTLVLNTDKSFISIGNNVSMGGGSIIECAQEVIIEKDVLIAYQVLIQDSNNHSLVLSERLNDNINWNRNGEHDWSKVRSAPVIIGKGCWLGAKSIILKGVNLAEGCIVGAGSVVTKSFPEYSVIAGNPAKLIRTLSEDER